MTTKRFKTVLVGCGGMGRGQAKLLAGIEEYELTAVCDTFEKNVQAVASDLKVKAYTDYSAMLAAEKPEVVAICTPNLAHAPQTIEAAKSGVKAIYCEKPMAVGLGEARAMVEACEKNHVVLIVNHQRRLGPDLVTARQLMEQGAIGDIKLIRANNAGDILSDGTHAIDSVLWLAGDPAASWTLGQVHREIDSGMRDRAAEQSKKTGFAVEAGYRFGHPVENGGMGVVMLSSEIRLEFFCGDMRDGYRAYQDYEIFGTKGRLWRTGDGVRPNLYIQDVDGGEWEAGVDENWVYRPVHKPGSRNIWRPVEIAEPKYKNLIEDGYRRMAQTIRAGELHPMNGRNALRSFEILTAIYESARTNTRVTFPVSQQSFPLQLMVEEHR